jgi:hypothetical protein
LAARNEINTEAAVAVPEGQTVKVTVYLYMNGVPAVPHAQACGHVAVRASKARGVKSGHGSTPTAWPPARGRAPRAGPKRHPAHYD